MVRGIVIFDFDGTLSIQRNNLSMWGLLWDYIGKSQVGFDLYTKFHIGQISREKWFQLTAQEFCRRISKAQVLTIADKISLREGAIELFSILKENGYELYILSGGLRVIIERVLSSYRVFFTDISANDFVFSEKGDLIDIHMTPYDYDGKREYVERLINNIGFNTAEVYYVGNSINDLSILSLPIKKICISPIGLSKQQIAQWTYLCSDLPSVAKYIMGVSLN